MSVAVILLCVRELSLQFIPLRLPLDAPQMHLGQMCMHAPKAIQHWRISPVSAPRRGQAYLSLLMVVGVEVLLHAAEVGSGLRQRAALSDATLRRQLTFGRLFS